MATLTTNIPVSTDLYTIDATSYDTFALTFVDGQVNRAQFPNVSVTFDFAAISLPADLSQWVTVTITQPATGRVAVKWAGNVRVDPGVSISTAASTATTVYAFTSTGRDWTVFPSSISGVASDLSSQYVARASLVQWSWAKDWDAVTGAAYSVSVMGASGQRHGAYMFDGSALETTYTLIPIPEALTTFDLWLLWGNPSATAGDVVWQASYELCVPGDEFNLFTTGNQITVTSPAQNVPAETRLLSGITKGAAVAVAIKLFRRGDVAGDTVNAQDVGAFALYVKAAT